MKTVKTTFTSGQLASILRLLDAKGMTPDRLQELLGSGILADVFDQKAALDRTAVRQALKLLGIEVLHQKLGFSVDYGISLQAMIALGEYKSVNEGITQEHFPMHGKGQECFEGILLKFDRFVYFDDALQAMKDCGYEPARIEHLLAFERQFPEKLRKMSMLLALGFVAKIGWGSSVAYIDKRRDDYRNLGVSLTNTGWNGHYWFLAIRKLPSAT